MNIKAHLNDIVSAERWTLLLGAVLITLSFLFLGARGQLAVCLGAGLMALNARLLRVLGGRLLRLPSDRPLPLGLLLLLFNGKLLGLALLIYLCVRYLHVEPLPFLLGVSVLPLGILLSAASRGLQPGPRGSAQPPTAGGEGEATNG